jgi:hypothetical protein
MACESCVSFHADVDNRAVSLSFFGAGETPARQPAGRRRYFSTRFDADGAHHSAIFVLQDVAMIGKGSNDIGIAKIHT